MSESGPSERARELVRGGYDTHVHIAPDVVERKISDIGLAWSPYRTVAAWYLWRLPKNPAANDTV